MLFHIVSVKVDSGIHSAYFQMPIDYCFNIIVSQELADFLQDWDVIELGMISCILLIEC